MGNKQRCPRFQRQGNGRCRPTNQRAEKHPAEVFAEPRCDGEVLQRLFTRPILNGHALPATLEPAAQLAQELSEAEEQALQRLNIELDELLRGNPPFRGRTCDKVLGHQLGPSVRELDKRGMLFADRDKGALKFGFFCVRKEWDEERKVWVLRLVLDRRPRNAAERQVRPRDDAFPQGPPGPIQALV